MTIYLNPECRSGLGEDTFWTWFAREFPGSSFDVPERLEPDDILLQYSTAPRVPSGGTRIALCWELYPEMARQLCSHQWDAKIARLKVCAAACERRVTPTLFTAQEYLQCGPVDVLPIGVDTDLFKPMDKLALRRKYGIPDTARVAFWCGTNHPMKGFDRVRDYAAEHPDLQMVCVWKSKRERSTLPGAIERCRVSQGELAELMNCADFMLVSGMLRPYFMVEWEAMACNLPLLNISGVPREFSPPVDPRAFVFHQGWARTHAKRAWAEYLGL